MAVYGNYCKLYHIFKILSNACFVFAFRYGILLRFDNCGATVADVHYFCQNTLAPHRIWQNLVWSDVYHNCFRYPILRFRWFRCFSFLKLMWRWNSVFPIGDYSSSSRLTPLGWSRSQYLGRNRLGSIRNLILLCEAWNMGATTASRLIMVGMCSCGPASKAPIDWKL